MNRRTARLLAPPVLAGCLAPVAIAASSASPAAAATPKYRASVILDSLSPSIARPGELLAIDGRIKNTGTRTLRDVEVRLRYSNDAVGSRGQLADMADGDTVVDGVSVQSSTVDVGDIAPSATAAMPELSTALNELHLPTFGVYPIAVEVRASVSGGERRVGINRTFLPWAPDPLQAKATQVTWLWPVVDVPRRSAQTVDVPATEDDPGTEDVPVFVDDDLAGAFSYGGRLSRLVTAAAGRTVTWVVDPMVLDDAQAMRDAVDPPYQVASTPAQTPATPGTGSEAARLFLDGLRAALNTPNGVATVIPLPYGDTDVVAARRGGLGNLITDARVLGNSVAATVLGPDVPLTTDVSVPPGGFADKKTLQLLGASSTSAVVLSDRAVPAKDRSYTATERATVRAGSATLDALLVDSTLSRLAAVDTTAPGAQVKAQQRFLAETAMVTAERPGVRRTIAIAPPSRWSPTLSWATQLLTMTAEAPWLQQVGLSDALAGEPAGDERKGLTYPGSAAKAELPAAYLDRVKEIGAAVTTTAGVLEDPSKLVDVYSAERLRMLSSALRRDGERQSVLVYGTRMALDNETAKIHLLPTRVTLGSRDATFPMSIVNDLDQPVHVKITFTADSPKLSIEDTQVITVAAGQKKPVTISAHAVANGVTSVTAQLRTPDGEVMGTGVVVPVRVAQYGVVGVIIIVVAVALLSLASLRQIIRRVRGRGPEPEPLADPPAVHPGPEATFVDAPVDGTNGAADSAADSVDRVDDTATDPTAGSVPAARTADRSRGRHVG